MMSNPYCAKGHEAVNGVSSSASCRMRLANLCDARHNLLFNYCNLLFLVFLCKNVILDLGDLFPCF